MHYVLRAKSEFSRNVATLMTGTTIAQAVPVAISPVLTRIYSPSDFGVLALFIAITSILGSVANGRYELAIMLPEKDDDALNVAALCLIISIAISLILLLGVIFFGGLISEVLGNEAIAPWLYLTPVSVFLIGVWNVLTYLHTRKKNYKSLRDANILRSLCLAGTQLIIGVFKPGVTGLISGDVISRAIADALLMRRALNIKGLGRKITAERLMAMAKRYNQFPKISLPSNLFTVLYLEMSSVLISSLYSVTLLGHYFMCQRVLGLPSTLLGAAVGQVFFEAAVAENKKTGKARVVFLKTIRMLFFVTAPIFTILFFTVEEIFAFVFGEEWRIAGVYAEVLLPLFFIRLLASPVSIINTVFERQIYGLYISIILLVSSVSVITVCAYFSLGEQAMFRILSLVLFFEYLLFLIHYYLLSGGDYIKSFLRRITTQ